MADAEKPPAPMESVPALRAAGSRPRSSATGYVIAGAIVVALLLVVLVVRPWGSGSNTTKPPEVDAKQAKFDAERSPQKVIAAIGIAPGARVADVGANTGMFSVHLARAVAPNGKVVATDIDREVLGELARRVEAAGLSAVVEPRVVPAQSPGLEANTYDAILLSQVDHLFDDPVGWLVAAKPALKSGGRIAITNTNEHKEKSLASAKQAGLRLVTEAALSADQFVAVFSP
jgi:precorrin-6B methylase 2